MGPPTHLKLGELADRDDEAPVLLSHFLKPSPPRGDFRTATREAPGALPSILDALQAPSLRVVPLAKSGRNPYAGFVFVGRASTCDVIFRDASVSKSHAVFERDPKDLRSWHLRDNRSHNGTFVNDRKLTSGERVAVASGDVIRFGAYPVYLIMADELRRILETMGPPA